MTPAEIRAWRKAQRARLIAEREGLSPRVREELRERIDAHIERSFPGLASARVAICWPIRGEYDARPLAQKLRARGAVTALPVVVGPGQPLHFRAWQPGVALGTGPHGIAYPLSSEPVVPTVALIPMVGWDAAGHRLGYGGGFFDRTLASAEPRPIAIGIGYEMSRIDTIHPQPWDVPMDWVVTERGVYRRDPEGLAFLGEPLRGEPSRLASPVCYAEEILPGYGGDPDP